MSQALLPNESWFPGDPDGTYTRRYNTNFWMREIIKDGYLVRVETSQDGQTWAEVDFGLVGSPITIVIAGKT